MYYFVSGKKIIARQSIGEALDTLPENFIQIQKSYIVNLSKIDSITTTHVNIDTTQIPMGSQYKPIVTNKFK